VIIKQAGGEAGAYNPEESPAMSPAWGFFNDWAGAAWLSSLRTQPLLGPAFYYGNRALGFIALEDLGDGESLIDLLQGGSAARAEAALLAHATTLGRMHAATAGRLEEFAALRTALGPADLCDRPYPAGIGLLENFRQVRDTCQAMRFSLPPALDAEVAAIAAAMEQPDGFLVYTQGDPCPGNDRCLEGGLRLFDFEFGLFRHALLDGVYWRVPFPTCSHANRLPPRLLRQVEATYRAELAKGCAAAGDDTRFRQAVVEAVAYWTLRTTAWHLGDALMQDGQWGIASLRQRVLARLGVLAETAAELNHLPVSGETCRRLRQHLKVLWPEVEEMPVFPAFRKPP
jgi:hypothetical protein